MSSQAKKRQQHSELTWCAAFAPALFIYLYLLTSHINSKPLLGDLVVIDEGALSKVVYASTRVEVLSSDFARIEGVLAVHDEEASSDYLLVSDAGANALYKWEQGNGLFTVGKTIYRNKLDCSPPAVADCAYLNSHGAAGMLIVPDATPMKLIMAERGNRTLAMLDASGGSERILLSASPSGDAFLGPLELAFGFYGKFIYFSDLSLRDEVAGKVYAVHTETLLSANGSNAAAVLVSTLLKRPFGVAKNSLDQTRMFISDSSADNAVVREYKVQSDGNLRDSTVFFDASSISKSAPSVSDKLAGAPLRLHGLTTDKKGVVYVCSTAGVLIVSPTGSLLGLFATNEPVFHVALSSHERYIYFTTASSLLRLAVIDV